MIGTTEKTFNPLPWQIAPWKDRKSPTILLTGSAGGGKSHVALEKINGYALKYPGTFALLLRKVKVSMTSGSALYYAETVAPSTVNHLPSKSRFEYPNGSIVAYMGLEDAKQRDRLKSIGTRGGVDIAFMEEATEFQEDDYNAVLARMRGTAAPWRQLILACNPDAPTHWIKLRLIDQGEATVYYSRAHDNKHNPNDYFNALDSLTGTTAARLRDGQWVQATGLVYEVWSEQDNITEKADFIPDGGPIFWAVDDGYSGELDPVTRRYKPNSHPRAILLFQLRNSGRLCLFDEVLRVKTQPEQHLNDVLELGYPYPDYAAVDKSAAALKGRLHDLGIATRNGASSVEESIKVMREWIAPDQNEYRRLLIHPRCLHFRYEIVSYRYGDNGKPVKEYDHTLDATRYLIWNLRYE